MRVREQDDLGTVAIHLLPFLLTNAKEGLVVSMDEASPDILRSALASAGVPSYCESEAAFQQRSSECEPWNTVDFKSRDAAVEELPMVDHFVLRLLPMGHIKSAAQQDEDFVKAFQDSEKWLRYMA